MSSYKEIVTKSVIGKGKKHFKNTYTLTTETNVDTVLGCWVINHNFKGFNNNGKVEIRGSFDVNIWYSYENNTKTSVINRNITYDEILNLKVKDDTKLDDNNEIIIRALNGPTCTDVNVSESNIEYVIEKTLGVEIIGEDKVKILVEDEDEDYEEIEDELTDEKIDEITSSIDEDYLEK